MCLHGVGQGRLGSDEAKPGARHHGQADAGGGEEGAVTTRRRAGVQPVRRPRGERREGQADQVAQDADRGLRQEAAVRRAAVGRPRKLIVMSLRNAGLSVLSTIFCSAGNRQRLALAL